MTQDSKSKLNLYLDQATIDKLSQLAASNFRSLSQQVAALVEDASGTNLVKESSNDCAPVTAPPAGTSISYRNSKKKNFRIKATKKAATPTVNLAVDAAA